jgi:adenine-specific DNA glycosylase
MVNYLLKGKSEIKHTTCGIFLKDGKILLRKRRDDEDNYAGLWDIPSGHVNKNESIEDALKREMKKEVKETLVAFYSSKEYIKHIKKKSRNFPHLRESFKYWKEYLQKRRIIPKSCRMVD